MPDIGHAQYFLDNISLACNAIDTHKIGTLAARLSLMHTNGGRLFILGVGGSAGNASHVVNDMRKLCNIEAYAPTDNVSELTARTNDDGFDTIFSGWLRVSRLSNKDAILILSVGGGNEEKKVSVNLIAAIKYAKSVGASVFGIVGRDDGYTAKNSDLVIIIPSIDDRLITPISEAFQSVIWHALVSHPVLQINKTKW